MVLIFTGNEQLDRQLNKKIENSRVVYYPEYILEEQEAEILIVSVQNNKFKFKDLMFNVRQKNIRIIMILENADVKELKDALLLGIYDVIFDPFSLDDIINKVKHPTPFSEISKYIKEMQEQSN